MAEKLVKAATEAKKYHPQSHNGCAAAVEMKPTLTCTALADRTTRLKPKKFLKEVRTPLNLPDPSDDDEPNDEADEKATKPSDKGKGKLAKIDDKKSKKKKGKPSLLEAFKNAKHVPGVRTGLEDPWGGYNWNRSIGRYRNHHCPLLAYEAARQHTVTAASTLLVACVNRYCSEDCHAAAHARMAEERQDYSYTHYFEPYPAHRCFLTLAMADMQAADSVEAWALQYVTCLLLPCSLCSVLTLC